ncbi:hypothetical protein LJC56_06545 [Christensenellaceae bacterium OttesenSCG-928-K19]|nr:hypothetical protein [Christensenellaceae bacterium OttesenSCG-928-K19]
MEKALDTATLESWYNENNEKYTPFSAEIEKLLSILIDQEGIHCHSIVHRVKTKESYLKKCETKAYSDPAKQVMDLAGVRIIAYTNTDVIKICNIIDREFDVDNGNSIDTATRLDTNKVGYLSVHKIIVLNKERLDLAEYSRFRDLKCEIQVRTMLQHAWAEIEHDRGYKFNGVLPPEIKRRLYLIAGVLEVMDYEFQQIADDIDQHAQSVQEKTKKGDLNIPIDSSSLMAYLQKKITTSHVDATLNNCDDMIIRELNGFGISTLQELDALFTEKILTYLSSEDVDSSYLGILREIMMLTDTQKYFSDAWNQNHWNGITDDDYFILKKYGLDTEHFPDFLLK